MAPNKRKRLDRQPSGDGGRPSPHRPGDTPLGQHDRDDGGGRNRGRGGHRGSNRRDSLHNNHGRNGPNHQQNQSPNPRRVNSNQIPASSPTPARQPPSPAMKPTAPIITKGPPSPVTNRQPPSPAMAKQPLSPLISKSNTDSAPVALSADGLNYLYDNLTDEKISNWVERGREEIVRHGVQSREDEDITELSSLFQEFIHAVVEKRLDATDAGACVKDILGEETSGAIKDSYAFAPHTLLLDSLAIVMDNNVELYQPCLREFLVATGVSPVLMRQVLDAPLLQQLGLIRDTFARLGVRQATNLLYRQANYNLLREETEGYSKLVTELFTTSSVASPSPEMAEQTFERVKALIGTFDLDVGRVLDVTLDVAAAVLIKQFKFFVKFLRISSWWPRPLAKGTSSFYIGGLPTWANPDYTQWNTSEEDEISNEKNKLLRDTSFWERAREVHLSAFFELGGRELTHVNTNQQKGANDDTVGDLEQQWTQETKTLPPQGNRVAAQLLGFKLLFYYGDLRDKADVLPANLLYLAALLIKIGFISLTDLYPHLSPNDDKMDLVREEQLKKIEEDERTTRGGPTNALLMAGVLPQGDDDNPVSSNIPRREAIKKVEPETKQTTAEAAESQKKLPEPLEQKVLLLIQLLTIGALPEALFILGRFPWIPETFPEVLSRIHRILHVMVEKVFSDSRPQPRDTSEYPTKEMLAFDQAGVAKGTVRLSRLPVKKSWRWPFPDKSDTNESQNYRFYWDEWADNIPVCQSVDDIFTLCNTFLNISGVNIGKDEALLSKLASIGIKSLADDASEANLARWHDLLRRLLLPALSHTKANASVVHAIWEMLKQYPITTRYSMYAEWFEGQISRLPAMKLAFARATSETRGTLKRVSLTNLSEMAKQLAKTSYSSPGIVFRVAFEQLESYPNLIEAFVECAKYFTDLSYDVLVWSLMNSLGKSRSRTQADHALTTSKWLQALSRFSGKVFRRYPMLSPTPVLQYVNDQLFRGNSTDLIILKEFITSMGGIVDSVDFTDYQVLSMAGGERLRRHTLIRGQDRRFDNVKSSKRLVQSLTDSKLAARFLINLAQHRQLAIFQVPEDEAHIKYLSSIVDDSHQILIQYLDFLWSNVDPGVFDTLVPSIPELIQAYGLDTSLVFLIGRASLAHKIYPWKAREVESAKEEAQKSHQESTDKEGDVSMSEAKSPNVDGNDRSAQAASGNEDQKPEDASLTLAPLQSIIAVVQSTMRPEIWQKMTPEFYVTFWALELGDLFCPEDMYKQEKDRLENEGQAILRDRSDMSRRGQERKNEKRQELLKQQLSLSMELKEHRYRRGKWKECLTEQFQSVFPGTKVKADVISDVLLEQCILPRVLLSPADTEYTYKFILALHEWRAPNFKLMSLYDRFFNANRLRSLIFTSTVREAEYLGRFLKLILRDLSRWHKNEPAPFERGRPAKDQSRLGAYEREARGPSERPFLGFASEISEDGEPVTLMEHSQFRDLLFRWHKNLNTALKSCLMGTEWMHIRNAITVLTAVLDFFPAVDFMATQFLTQLQKISKQEAASKTSADSEEGHRVDLSVAAQGAMSELQRRKSRWVMVQAFRPNTVGGPQSDDKAASSNLRPTASDFQPQSGKSPLHRQTPLEKEDGEVHDGKSQTAASASQTNSSVSKDNLPARPSVPSRVGARDDSSMMGPPRSSTPSNGYGSNNQGAKDDARPHTLPDRPSHNLPTRPDVPIPAHYTPERFSQPRGHERRDGRDSRESRGSRDPRDPRDSWDVRDGRDTKDSREGRDPREQRAPDSDRPDRMREFNDRRAPDLIGRDAGPADLPPRPRPHEREWPSRENWGGRPQDRPSEPSAPLPAPQPAAVDTPEPTMNPQRAALFAKDEADRLKRVSDSDHKTRGRRPGPNDVPVAVNPERAALIGDQNEVPPARPTRDDGRERAPRTQSPRRSGRHGHDQGPPSAPFDERHGPAYPQEHRSAGRNHRDRSPNSGSHRADKGMDRENDRMHVDKARESQSGFHRPSSHGQDTEHRPLPPPYQDQNYGRLNQAPPNPDIPSGPRGRGRGVSRSNQHGTSPAVGSRTESRYNAPETPRAPSPERAPPSGPSSSRGRRSGYEHAAGPSTPSVTPIAPHSDRKRGHVSGSEKPSPVVASTGVHPDRLAQMGGSQLPPPPPPPPPPGPPPHNSHGSHSSHGRHSMPSTGNSERSGPRHSSGIPTDPIVPTGPSSSGERVRSGGGRRQLAGINSTLQKSQTTGPEGVRTSSRGSQQRQMLSNNSDVQVLAGGSPGPTNMPDRQDNAWQEPSNRSAADGENGSSRGEHDRNRRDREGRSDRSKRSSRRSSRDRERDNKEHSDHRDRRSVGGTVEGGTREDREARRSARETGGRETTAPPGSRELMGGRDSRHRGDAQNSGQGGRGGDDRANRGSRSAPRDGNPRPDEQRREPRDDRGRKRRGEDVEGSMSNEREKRPRR